MSFASDVSPHGAFDMAGNVSEWCTADDKPALRGGNWYSSPETCKLLHVRNPPAKRSDFVGFRPALDAPALPR
jgi:formylglycine-generating enzyme required for sulfatase activity